MNNSSKKPPQQIIQLTKIKQWYLPVDAESYNILKAAGAPLIRFHEDFLPTLSLLTKPRNIKAKVVSFNDDIMHPFFDKLGELWNNKEHRRATINNTSLKFETTHASILKNSKAAIEKIEASLRRFFTRWGYTAVFEFSESRGKCKLHVTYKHNSNNLPVIPLVDDPASQPVVRIKLGYIRISLTMMTREVEVNVAIASGTGWNSISTTRCLYTQFGNVKPMINSLMDIVNKDQFNSENSND